MDWRHPFLRASVVIFLNLHCRILLQRVLLTDADLLTLDWIVATRE
jgi:hypothetical protein